MTPFFLLYYFAELKSEFQGYDLVELIEHFEQIDVSTSCPYVSTYLLLLKL